MADPILVDFYRAQVIFQGKSNLAEDVFINNFVFRNDTAGVLAPAAADTIADTLHTFYDTITTSGNKIAGLLSGVTINAAYKIKVYDLGQAPPRLPIERTRTLTGLGSGTPFPPEVAICLSYYAGRPLPRRRGRIFVGPLTASAFEVNNDRLRVSGAARTTLGQAAARMADEGFGGMNWCVLSQMDANAFEISGGWTDDAPDIQRRRGTTPILRDLWGLPPEA